MLEIEERRAREGMRERERKRACKEEEEIVGDATILMLLDKITHVSFPTTAALVFFSHLNR